MPARLALLVLLTATMSTSSSFAEQFAKIGTFGATFARIPVDARGEAMGLATTVNPTGPTAFWWNAAPLPESDRVAASYTIWQHLFDDIKWRPMALRASWGNLTAAYLWGRLRFDPILVRTAYEPDGDGTYVEAGADLHQFSFAADLVPWITDDDSAWAWTIGTSARNYRQRLAEVSTSAWDADLASSLAWRLLDATDGQIRLHGTFLVRNLFQSSIEYEETNSALARYYHMGLGLEAGFGRVWRGNRMLAVTVSHTWRRDLESVGYPTDSEHLGLELTVGGIASLRGGDRSDGSYFGEGWSWGGGLQYRFDVWSGIRVAVDYARMDLDELISHDTMNHWTFTAGVDLP